MFATCYSVYSVHFALTVQPGWLRSTVVERRSLACELSLSCTRPAADGWPLLLV